MFQNLFPYLPSALMYLFFCLTHSLFASSRVKEKIFNRAEFIRPFYRILYNLLALILIILYLLLLPEDETVYRVEGVLFYVFIILQLVSLSAIIKATVHSGSRVFLGIKQIKNYMKQGEPPSYLDEPERGELVTSGFYRYMRHPTYTFSMLLLIFSPIMTANLIYITVCLGIYFWVGSNHEEKDLVRRFGDSYRDYQDEVPKFIPGPIYMIKRFRGSE